MKKNDKNRIMPYVPFNERDSAYYKKMASMRKNPYKGFKEDPEFAKLMSKKAAKARKDKRVASKKQVL
jgi:hypothetical protein